MWIPDKLPFQSIDLVTKDKKRLACISYRLLPEPLWSLLRYVPPSGNVLDAGCGNLYYTVLLKNFNPCLETIGVDIVASDFISARKNNFVQSTIESLPFENESFECVFCFSALQYIRDDEEVIREFQRVLKSKGKLLLTLPTSKSVFRLIRDLEIRTKVWRESDARYFHHYTKDVLRRLTAEKFKMIDVYGYNFNFIPRLLLLVQAQFGRKVENRRRGRGNVRRFDGFRNWVMKRFFGFLICAQNMRGPISDLCYHYIVVLEKK